MKLSSAFRFLISTLILVVALIVLFLNHSLAAYLLSLFLAFTSYLIYANAVNPNGLAGFFSKPKVWTDLLFDLMILTAAGLIFNVFRTSSNLEFLFNQGGKLLTEHENGQWQHIDDFKGGLNPELEYENSHTSIYSLRVKRKSSSLIQKIEGYLNPNEVMIFEFSPENEYLLFADTPDLNSVNAQKAMQMSGASFVVNSNFYGSDNNLLGELILDGKRYGKQSRDASGFFRVIKGKPYVGSKSVLNSIPGRVEYSCQAMPSVIKNGEVFSYIRHESGPYKLNWGRKTYRNLVGMKKDGKLVFIVSNRGALLSVKEIAILAELWGVHNASLFDGGAALQYRFENSDYETAFSTFNNNLNLGRRMDELIMQRYRINFSSKSPVYICVKEVRAQAD